MPLASSAIGVTDSEWREYGKPAQKPRVLASTKCPDEVYTLAPSQLTICGLTAKAARSASWAIAIACSTCRSHGWNSSRSRGERSSVSSSGRPAAGSSAVKRAML